MSVHEQPAVVQRALVTLGGLAVVSGRGFVMGGAINMTVRGKVGSGRRVWGPVVTALAVSLLLGPAVVSAQNDDTFTDSSTTERRVKESIEVTSPSGDPTDISGGAIFTGDIVSGQNRGNEIALGPAEGGVTIDGGDSYIPTNLGLNVGSSGNSVDRDGDLNDNDASTDNTVDSSDF